MRLINNRGARREWALPTPRSGGGGMHQTCGVAAGPGLGPGFAGAAERRASGVGLSAASRGAAGAAAMRGGRRQRSQSQRAPRRVGSSGTCRAGVERRGQRSPARAPCSPARRDPVLVVGLGAETAGGRLWGPARTSPRLRPPRGGRWSGPSLGSLGGRVGLPYLLVFLDMSCWVVLSLSGWFFRISRNAQGFSSA